MAHEPRFIEYLALPGVLEGIAWGLACSAILLLFCIFAILVKISANLGTIIELIKGGL
jgi:hypothetical protein